ncbi:BsaA family SipW-dependent biofilm matrix protein [Vagococcus carniphilus]|uniref:BsaA family SipW-dependent biofilm matrix protein n=1 Tax=Vagococcus carniphilus TaxID=218144 RepID=UPI003BABCCF6
MKKDKRKKWLASAAALAAVAALVGTFAWFTSTDKAVNEFEGELAGNDIEIVEDFVKPKPWEPGTKVNKDVAVKNNGKINSLIRVSLSETLDKLAQHESRFAKSEADVTGIVGADAKLHIFELGKKDDALTAYTDVKTDKEYKLTLTKAAVAEQNGDYTFKVKEKATKETNGTMKYEYVTYWEKTGGGKKLYAKTGGLTRKDVEPGVNTEAFVTPKNTPQFQYVNLKFNTTKKDWPADKPTLTATPAIPADGNVSVIVDSPLDAKIKIEFVNLSSTPKEGKWMYNQADGIFYYVGVVAPEQQTAQLIDSVTLDASAGNEYSKVKYVLDVNAKGIQAVAAAVDTDEWLNGSNKPIADALKALKEVKKQ